VTRIAIAIKNFYAGVPRGLSRWALPRDVLTALRPVAGVFLWSRATIWAVALFALLAFEPNRSLSPTALRSMNPALTHDLGYWTDVWARWDSVWFLQIAHSGYGVSPQASAFYPLYPALVGVLGRIFFGHYVLAGIVVSLSATLVAFALLYQIAEKLIGPEGAHRAVVYLAIFPMALFLQGVYSESLLLVLMLAAFLFAERNSWLLAWCFTGFALLTRPTAAALIPALLVLAWRSPQRRRALIGLPLAPLEFALFPLALWTMTGDPFAFIQAEKIWHRHIAIAGPLTGLWEGAKDGIVGLFQIATRQPIDGRQYATGSDYTLLNSAFNAQAFLFLVLFLFLAVIVWRRFGAVYGLFTACSLAIPLSSPNTTGWPLLSFPRFGLTIFPLFLALAVIGKPPRIHSAIVGVSAVMLGAAVVQWALWQWMG
jgi:hypothetical protein